MVGVLAKSGRGRATSLRSKYFSVSREHHPSGALICDFGGTFSNGLGAGVHVCAVPDFIFYP